MRYVVKSVNDRMLHLADEPYTRSYCKRLSGALVVVDSDRASEWIADRTVTVCGACRTALKDRHAAALAMEDSFMVLETERPRPLRPAAEPMLFDADAEPTLFDAVDAVDGGWLPVVGLGAVIAAGVPAVGAAGDEVLLPVTDAETVTVSGAPVAEDGMLPVIDAGAPVTASVLDRSNASPADRSNALPDRSLTGPAGAARGSSDLSGAHQEAGGLIPADPRDTAPEPAPVAAEADPAEVRGSDECAARIMGHSPATLRALTLPGDVAKAEAAAEAADIVIRHTHEDGTTVEGSAKGDGVWEALHPLGWTYRRTPGIFIRGSRYKGADRWKINRAADAVRALGLSCAVVIEETMSFAEREAARVGAAEERTERFTDRAGRAAAASQSARDTSDQIGERFWMGQPILVGHHSEGRARRDQERMHNAMRKSIDEDKRAGYWANRAAASEAYERYRTNPSRTLRRIEKLEAERRGVLRERDGIDDKGRKADVWRREPSEARREELTRRLAEYDEELTYWAETIKEAERRGFKVWGKPDFVRGDFARCRGTWYEVTRVNAKTVTVPHILAEFDGGTVGTVGGCRVVTRAATDGTRHKGSTYTLPYNELGGRMSAEQMQAALAGEEIPADPRDVTPEPAPETGEAERTIEHHGQAGPAVAADVSTEADPADVWEGEGGTVRGVPAPAATVTVTEADHQAGTETTDGPDTPVAMAKETTTTATPDLEATAATVAELLGDGWAVTVDAGDWADMSTRTLVHTDGRQVRLCPPDGKYGAHPGRWVAYGMLPNTPDDEKPYTGDIKSGSITCAGASTPRRLASEITRRLLPPLTEGHATWCRRLDDLRTSERLRRAVADRLAAIPGLSAPVRQTWQRNDRAYRLSWEGPTRNTDKPGRYWTTPRAGVTVDQGEDGERVGIELSGLSAEQAEAVLRALTGNGQPPTPAATPAAAAARPVPARRRPAADPLALFPAAAGERQETATADVSAEADPADVWEGEGGTVPGVETPTADVANASFEAGGDAGFNMAYRSVMDMSRDEWAADAGHRVRTECHARQRVSADPADWLTADELAEARTLGATLAKATRRALNTAARDHDKNALPTWLRDARFNVSGALRELAGAERSTDMDGHAYAWHRLQKYAEEQAKDATTTARGRLAALVAKMRAARDAAAEEALQAAIAREVANRNSDEGWARELERRERVRRGPTVTTITVHADGTSTVGEPRPFRMPGAPR